MVSMETALIIGALSGEQLPMEVHGLQRSIFYHWEVRMGAQGTEQPGLL